MFKAQKWTLMSYLFSAQSTLNVANARIHTIQIASSVYLHSELQCVLLKTQNKVTHQTLDL